MVAQGAHASLKVFFDRIEYCDHGEMRMNRITPEMASWINGVFAKICVSVDSEAELLQIYDQAKIADLPVAIIEDCGLTEFHNVPTKTCLAIGPDEAEKIDKITGHLKLL